MPTIAQTDGTVVLLRECPNSERGATPQRVPLRCDGRLGIGCGGGSGGRLLSIQLKLKCMPVPDCLLPTDTGSAQARTQPRQIGHLDAYG